jgi:hypothetical protein
MQATSAKLAKIAAKIEALVAFLTQRCLLDEPSARAIATRNARKRILNELAYGHSFLAYSSDDDVPEAVKAYLQLEDLFEGEQLELITSKLAAFFLGVRAATAAGKAKAAVTTVRKLVDVYTGKFGVWQALLRGLLDSAICLHSVTINGLRDARSKPDGVMGLFPSGMREYLLRKIPELPKMFEHLLAEQDKLRRALHMLCPAHGFTPSQARNIYAKLLQDSVTFERLGDVMGIIPTASDDPAYIADWGVMRVFRGAEKRETLKKQFENIQALLEDLARNGPELGANFELGVEPAELEPVAAHITAPSRKRVLVPEVLEAPEELICDDIADLDRKCCSTDSTHDTTVSAEQASAEDETGFTTPSPTKISNLSKLELFRLQCAPLKMPRQRQD